MKRPIVLTCLLLVTLFLTTSCESDVLFETDNGHTKLYAFCEISPKEKIKVHVSTAVGINTDDKFFFPKQSDVTIKLFKEGEELLDPGFRYIGREKAFVSQGSFRPEVGVNYGLEIVMKNTDYNIETIYAETFIPQKDSLVQVIAETTSNHFLSVKISKADLKEGYYKLSFATESEMRSLLEVARITSNRKGLKVINDDRILLIDASSLMGDIVLETFLEGISDKTHLFTEFSSITPDAYQYYQSFDGQRKDSQYFLSEPIMDRSNFEKGLGLFTGFNSSFSSFEIR